MSGVRTSEDIQPHRKVLQCLEDLYLGLAEHDGFGDMRVEVRILKRGQKEVIIHCGKQYRFVVDCPCAACGSERQKKSRACVTVRAAVIPTGTAHQVNDFQ